MRRDRTNILRAIALAGSLFFATEAGAQEAIPCEVPNRIIVGTGDTSVEFTATTEQAGQMVLHRPSRLREVKWAASVVFPWLRGRDIAIFLHPLATAHFLADYEDIDTIRNVRFFLACREGDGFRTVPATVLRVSSNDDVAAEEHAENENQNVFVGLTIPIQDKPTDQIVASYLPVDQQAMPRIGDAAN